MAEKAPCSCGCGKLVSASTDHRHRAGKTTPRAKATCLTSQGITATTTKFHPSREKSPQRKRQRTNTGFLTPLEIQDGGAIDASSSSVNDVPPTANMAVDMESVNPPLSPNHAETGALSQLLILVQRPGQTPLAIGPQSILMRSPMERRAERHRVNLKMGEIVLCQIQIAMMMDLGLRTPLTMNLRENWVILVRILTCLFPRNLVIMY